MRIAFVYPDLGHKGGAENVVMWTAAGLLERGHHVRIFTAKAACELWPDAPQLANCIEQVTPETRGKRIPRALRTGEKLAPRFAEFDVVYAHNRYALLWGLAAADRLAWYCQEPSRRLHAPITDRFLVEALERKDVDQDHPALQNIRRVLAKLEWGPIRRRRTARNRALEAEWVQAPQRVFVNSHFSASVLSEALGREPEVLDLGVPELRAAVSPAQREGVAVISSGSPKKNLFGVLDSIAALEQRGICTADRFHIWGVRTDTDEVRARVASLKIEKRVELHGFLDDAASARRLAGSRACLFLPVCEPFGLVAVEALRLGVPVVASNHGGPAEIVERCGAGLTADPLRPDQVAEALETVLAAGDSWQAHHAAAEAAGKRAADIYGMPRYLDRTEAVLSEIAGQSSSST